MAEQFNDPVAQANLNQLLAGLRAKQAELDDILAAAKRATGELGTVARDEIALQQEEARLLSAQRPSGAGPIQETISAVRQLTAAEKALNAEIVRQIELQAQAAAAARTASTQTGGLLGAAMRVEGAVTGAPTAVSEQAAALQAARTAPRPPLPALPAYPTQAYPVAPLPPVVATAGGSGEAAADTSKLTAEQERLVASARAGAASESLIGAAMQRNILIYGQADNSLQRHGALTTEFIQAAGRGEVTIQEFGNQIGQTIGKFAGWTAAAGAVYGVLGSVTELARGAIDTSNAVGQLSRTIDGLNKPRAAQAIINMAHETNTSMKEAGDAVFLFSRTFHNVPDATNAAGLALRAFALDGVTVADQVKAQTALFQQFGVSAQDMGSVYDMLAAGQREFNARVTEQIPLLQRSASAVKNAGGDLTQLLELSTIALRTTQLSGSQVGTAFSRAAANFLAPSTTKGQTDLALLRSFGIDTSGGFTDILFNALKRSPSLTPDQIAQVSHAIFGPLRGGLMAGMFTGGPQLVEPVKKSFADSGGSFFAEFAKELGTSRQELKAIVNDVQQLGAALSQSGLTQPLGLMVKGLGDALSLTTELVQAWDKLPGPIKEAAGLMAAFYAARAVAGRINIPIPGFGPSAESLAQTQMNKGLQAEQDAYQAQHLSAARQASSASFETQAAERARDEAVTLGATDEQIAAAEQRYQSALVRQLGFENQRDAIQQDILALQERNNAIAARVAAGMSAEAALAAEGAAFRLNTLTQGRVVPNAVTAVGASEAEIGAAAATAAASIAASPATMSNLQRAASAAAVTRTEVIGAGPVGAGYAGAQTYNAGAQAYSAAEADMAAGAGPIGLGLAAQQRMAQAMETQAVATGTEATLASRATRTAGASLSATAGMIGRFVPALFGLGLAAGIFEQGIQNMDQAASDVQSALSEQPATIAGLEQKARDVATAAQKQVKKISRGGQSGTLGDIFGWLSEQPVIGGLEEAMGVYSKPQAATGQSAQLRNLANYYQQLADQVQKDATAFASTGQGRQRFYAAIAAAEAKAAAATPTTGQGPEALNAFEAVMQKIYESAQAAVPVTNIKGGDPFGQFGTNSLDNNVKNLQTLADRMKLYGSTPELLQQMAYLYEYLAAKYAGSRDDKELQAVSQAQGMFLEAVRKSVQDLIDQAGVAGSKQAKVALLNAAKTQLNAAENQLRAANLALRAVVATDQVAYDANVKALAEVDQIIGLASNSTVRTVLAWALNELGLAQTTAKSYNELQAAKQALAGATTTNDQINSQLDAQLKSINTQTASALKVPKVPKTPSSEDPFALARLRGEIAKAQAEGDPVKQAQADEAFAQLELAGARNEHERLQAQLDLITAENAYNKAVEDRSQAMYTYLESTTRDPVKDAKYALQAATEAVSFALEHGGPDTQNYYDAKAKQNDAKNKLFDAHLQVAEDNIQFGLDLNKISTETALLEYEKLLHLHNLTLQQRQDLLRKIDALKKGTADSFADLDLGSIKLPTPYEIRRSLMAAQGGTAITQTFTINNNISDERGAIAVGVQLDRHVHGVGKAIARAQGTR